MLRFKAKEEMAHPGQWVIWGWEKSCSAIKHIVNSLFKWVIKDESPFRAGLIPRGTDSTGWLYLIIKSDCDWECRIWLRSGKFPQREVHPGIRCSPHIHPAGVSAWLILCWSPSWLIGSCGLLRHRYGSCDALCVVGWDTCGHGLFQHIPQILDWFGIGGVWRPGLFPELLLSSFIFLCGKVHHPAGGVWYHQEASPSTHKC